MNSEKQNSVWDEAQAQSQNTAQPFLEKSKTLQHSKVFCNLKARGDGGPRLHHQPKVAALVSMERPAMKTRVSAGRDDASVHPENQPTPDSPEFSLALVDGVRARVWSLRNGPFLASNPQASPSPC